MFELGAKYNVVLALLMVPVAVFLVFFVSDCGENEPDSDDAEETKKN